MIEMYVFFIRIRFSKRSVKLKKNTFIHIHTHTHIRTYTCTHAHIHICTYTHTHIHSDTHIVNTKYFFNTKVSNA